MTQQSVEECSLGEHVGSFVRYLKIELWRSWQCMGCGVKWSVIQLGYLVVLQ